MKYTIAVWELGKLRKEKYLPGSNATVAVKTTLQNFEYNLQPI